MYSNSKIGDQLYSRGGVQNLAPYIKALQKEFKDQFLWLDSGDQFSGTLESTLTKGKIITEFFNIMGLNGTTLGNHEFDNGIQFLNKRIKSSNFPYVVNNIAMKNGKTLNLENIIKYKIINVQGIKVGITGISTVFTPQTTSGDISDYIFKSYKKRIIKNSKLMREQGANIVILIAHAGTRCKSKIKGEDYLKNRLTTEENDIGDCHGKELVKLLDKLPKYTVDAIYAGHVHNSVHSFIKGVPVLDNNFHALTFNVGYFSFNKKTKEYIRNKTVIEGPVPVCSKIFSKSLNCNFYSKKVDVKEIVNKNGEITDFYFHNLKIQPLNRIKKMMNKFSQLVLSAKNKIMFKLDFRMQRDYENENPLSNFVCDMLRNITKSDFCVFNQGAFRAIWEAGPINYYKYYEMFSLRCQIVTIELTGKQVKRMMEILNSGDKAFYATSGLTSFVKKIPQKSLVKLTMSNGKEIKDNKIYTIVTNEFLVNGGDDFSNVIKEIPLDIIKAIEAGTLQLTQQNRQYLHKVARTLSMPALNLPKV